MLIGVVGLNGSGKDTIAEFLADRHGYMHRDLGQEIRNELKRQGRNHQDRNEMISLGNEMRQKHGFNYWCRNAIESAKSRDVVITSLRNPLEVEEIKNRNGTVMEVFADQRLRFERTAERMRKNPGSHGDIKSFDVFRTMEEKELTSDDPAKQQLIKCIEMADVRIDNNGAFEQLYKEIEEALSQLSK